MESAQQVSACDRYGGLCVNHVERGRGPVLVVVLGHGQNLFRLLHIGASCGDCLRRGVQFIEDLLNGEADLLFLLLPIQLGRAQIRASLPDHTAALESIKDGKREINTGGPARELRVHEVRRQAGLHTVNSGEIDAQAVFRLGKVHLSHRASLSYPDVLNLRAAAQRFLLKFVEVLLLPRLLLEVAGESRGEFERTAKIVIQQRAGLPYSSPRERRRERR